VRGRPSFGWPSAGASVFDAQVDWCALCRVVSCRVVSCRGVLCCMVLCCVVVCCVVLCCVLCCAVLCLTRYDNNGTEHVSILLLLLSSIAVPGGHDLLHLPFGALFCLAVLFPRLRRVWLWRGVVLYCEFFVLLTYWWHFSWMEELTAVTSRLFGSMFRTTTSSDAAAAAAASLGDPCADATALRWTLAFPLALLLMAAFQLRVVDSRDERQPQSAGTAALIKEFQNPVVFNALGPWGQRALSSILRALYVQESMQRTLSASRAGVAWMVSVAFPVGLVALSLIYDTVSVLSMLYASIFSAYALLMILVRDKIKSGPRKVRGLSHTTSFLAGGAFMAQCV